MLALEPTLVDCQKFWLDSHDLDQGWATGGPGAAGGPRGVRRKFL